MGYLSLKQPITVIFDDGTRRSFSPGVNKDVTKDQSEHWYVKAAGGEYFDKIEDAHKNAPEMKNVVAARRAEWEQATRAAMLAAINSETLRKDLVALEKEMGVDTKKADAVFKETLKDEEDRMTKLRSEAEEADAVQKEEDTKSALTPAEAEVVAAGSAEVANTEMDGPAKAEADQAAEEGGKTIIGDRAVVPGTPEAKTAQKVEDNKKDEAAKKVEASKPAPTTATTQGASTKK